MKKLVLVGLCAATVVTMAACGQTESATIESGSASVAPVEIQKESVNQKNDSLETMKESAEAGKKAKTVKKTVTKKANQDKDSAPTVTIHEDYNPVYVNTTNVQENTYVDKSTYTVSENVNMNVSGMESSVDLPANQEMITDDQDLPNIQVGDPRIDLIADEFDEYGHLLWQMDISGGEIEFDDDTMSGIIASAHFYDEPYDVTGLDMNLFGKTIDVNQLPDDPYENILSGSKTEGGYRIMPDAVLDSTVDVDSIEKNDADGYTVTATLFRDPAMAEQLMRGADSYRTTRKEQMSRNYPIGTMELTIVPNAESSYGFNVTGVTYDISFEDFDQGFTNDDLLQIARDLGVPEGMEVSIQQSEPYYIESHESTVSYVQVFDMDGSVICHAEVDVETLEMEGGIYMYTDESE